MAKRRNFSAAFKAKVALEAIKAQNSMAAVSAEGRAHWVSILRLNSSCRRSIALVVTCPPRLVTQHESPGC